MRHSNRKQAIDVKRWPRNSSMMEKRIAMPVTIGLMVLVMSDAASFLAWDRLGIEHRLADRLSITWIGSWRQRWRSTCRSTQPLNDGPASTARDQSASGSLSS